FEAVERHSTVALRHPERLVVVVPACIAFGHRTHSTDVLGAWLGALPAPSFQSNRPVRQSVPLLQLKCPCWGLRNRSKGVRDFEPLRQCSRSARAVPERIGGLPNCLLPMRDSAINCHCAAKDSCMPLEPQQMVAFSVARWCDALPCIWL